MRAVLELFDSDVDREFLLSAGLFSELARDQIGGEDASRVFGLEPFPRDLVELAVLQFAKTAPAMHDGFDRDEINQIVAACRENRVAQPEQASRFATPKACRGKRPKQPAPEAPDGLVSA